MERTIKIILAGMLFLCLLNMPYGYYQLVRFVSFSVFSYLGYNELKKSNQEVALIYFGLAILFQPFIKIILGRVLWNIVDVIVGIGLLLNLNQKKEPVK